MAAAQYEWGSKQLVYSCDVFIVGSPDVGNAAGSESEQAVTIYAVQTGFSGCQWLSKKFMESYST